MKDFNDLVDKTLYEAIMFVWEYRYLIIVLAVAFVILYEFITFVKNHG